MPATARVFITGDASSIKKAMEEAGLYAEAASVKIAKAGKEVESSYLSMSGAGKKAASEIEGSAGRIGSAFGGLASSGNIAIAAIVGVAAAAEGIKHVSDTFDELAHTTRTLTYTTGLSTESASKYAAIAKVQGIQATGLQQAFGTLSKNVQAVTNAHDGLTKSAKTQENAFKLLGISTKELVADHHNMNVILPQVVDKFEHMKPSTEKAALGMALFGRGWKTLVPLLHEGVLGLHDLEKEAESMGVVLGGNAKHQSEQLAQAQDKLKFAMLGLEVTIAEKVAPALTKLISSFAGVVAEFQSGTSTVSRVFRAMGNVISDVWKANIALDQGFIKDMGLVVAGAKGMASGVSSAFNAVKTAVSSGLSGAEDVVKGFFNAMYDAGKFIIEGLEKGIESKIGDVTSVFKHGLEDVEGVANSIFHFGSPSKVMEKHGENISLGLAAGIKKSGPVAVTASMSVSQEILKFWESHGFSHAAAAGFVGNAKLESGLNPGEAGGGLYQQSGDGASGAGVSGSVAQQSQAVLERLGPLASSLKHITDPARAAHEIALRFERAAGTQPGEPGYGTPEYGTAHVAQREAAAREAFGSVGITGGVAAKAVKAAVPKLTIGSKELAAIAKLIAAAEGDHAKQARAGGWASEVGQALSQGQARWAAEGVGTPASLATPEGAKKAGEDVSQAVLSKKALEKYYREELVALRKEIAAFVKLRDQYRAVAKKQKGAAAKEKALHKAAEYDAKIKQAQNTAKALGGTIYAAETAVIEAEHTQAALPGEIAAAAAEATATTQGGDLNAYQAANSKVDAEERAGLLSPEQARAAKIANAKKAEGGGFGALSEEGLLQVKGDLREFSSNLQEANNALEQHNQLQAEANKVLAEFVDIGNGLSQVEAGSFAKSLADVVSGQIGGKGYQGRRLNPGAGIAARY